MKKGHVFTLCWDCAKATGGCSWSDRLTPVEGWTAVPRRIASHEIPGMDSSYHVAACPEFVADAERGGTRRTEVGA